MNTPRLDFHVLPLVQARTLTCQYWFNSPAFVSERADGESWFLMLAAPEGEGIQAWLPLTIKDGIATAPSRGPWGGIELSRGLPAEALEMFVQRVMGFCREKGVNAIRITQPPLDYPGDENSLVCAELTKAGLEVMRSEVNQSIHLDGRPFADYLHESKRKRLRIAKEEGNFRFAKMDLKDEPQAYPLIVDTRQRIGVPTSMSEADLLDDFARHPARYHLFCLYKGDVLVALSLSVRVAPQILYNFYHADHSAHRSLSPLLIVLEEIVDGYCKEQGISYLDLGISTLLGERNDGLFFFKSQIGARAALKQTYEYRF